MKPSRINAWSSTIATRMVMVPVLLTTRPHRLLDGRALPVASLVTIGSTARTA